MVVTYRLKSGDIIARMFKSTDDEDTVVNFGFPEALLDCVLNVEVIGDDYSKVTISDLCDLAVETSFLSVTVVQHHLLCRSKDESWPSKKDSWEMT